MPHVCQLSKMKSHENNFYFREGSEEELQLKQWDGFRKDQQSEIIESKVSVMESGQQAVSSEI